MKRRVSIACTERCTQRESQSGLAGFPAMVTSTLLHCEQVAGAGDVLGLLADRAAHLETKLACPTLASVQAR